eukprot:1141287-Pelagomonas_calceolata.AAC.3
MPGGILAGVARRRTCKAVEQARTGAHPQGRTCPQQTHQVRQSVGLSHTRPLSTHTLPKDSAPLRQKQLLLHGTHITVPFAAATAAAAAAAAVAEAVGVAGCTACCSSCELGHRPAEQGCVCLMRAQQLGGCDGLQGA